MRYYVCIIYYTYNVYKFIKPTRSSSWNKQNAGSTIFFNGNFFIVHLWQSKINIYETFVVICFEKKKKRTFCYLIPNSIWLRTLRLSTRMLLLVKPFIAKMVNFRNKFIQFLRRLIKRFRSFATMNKITLRSLSVQETSIQFTMCNTVLDHSKMIFFPHINKNVILITDLDNWTMVKI